MPQKNNLLLCLDLGSTTTGWAVFDGDVLTSAGILKFKNKTVNKVKLPRAYRYLQFEQALVNIGTKNCVFGLTDRPSNISYERAMGSWKTNTGPETNHALLCLLEIYAYHTDTQIHGVPQTALKKTATGKGNASKDLVLECAHKKWPHVNIETHDQADAMFLGVHYNKLLR